MADYTIDGTNITITSHDGLSDYLNSGGSLSGMTIVLTASSSDTGNNVYTLDDLLPGGTAFTSGTSIVVGSGVVLSDKWDAYNTLYNTTTGTQPSTYSANITSIVLQGNSYLRFGYPVLSSVNTPSNAGESAARNHFALTGGTTANITYDSTVNESSPVYYESVYYSSPTANPATARNQLTGIPAVNYFTTDGNGDYTSDGSSIQFRIVSTAGNLLTETSNPTYTNVVNNANLRVQATSNSGSSVVALQPSGRPNYSFRLPTVGFDTILFAAAGSTLSDGQTTAFYGDNAAELKCFLSGTLIETTSGWRAVDEIEVGDQVITYVDGNTVSRSVVWVGSSNVKASADNFLIRIVRNALADNVPSSDLYVTEEHCLFFDGNFVPARMLVNGSSISRVYDMDTFRVYHIELEEHAVINAQGVMTESYLHTDNLYNLKSVGKVTKLHASRQVWGVDSAAPLNTERGFVEPIYRFLEQRAVSLGMEQKVVSVETTYDPSLSFITSSGKDLYFSRKNNWVFVTIPQGVNEVYVKSNSVKLSEMEGPFVDDRRNLGVLVGKVLQVTNEEIADINIFESGQGNGWYICSKSANWTNGYSKISLELQDQSVLALEIIETPRYFAKNEQNQTTICRNVA
ncbi:Hint domain-containing protein [Entomobacter blattae]|uniref:Hint domain protein n=1 Tax=Entomobacter blattae TaxID=2762277 RepID=A0A7H1NP89_9PROT|nr:Hint domain-containing protein [Entomobacter blattae]QNT77599.1 Hint domain protein [Entomobacter blattae]